MLASGMVRAPVGLLVFKISVGSSTSRGGFDSHPFPPFLLIAGELDTRTRQIFSKPSAYRRTELGSRSAYGAASACQCSRAGAYWRRRYFAGRKCADPGDKDAFSNSLCYARTKPAAQSHSHAVCQPYIPANGKRAQRFGFKSIAPWQNEAGEAFEALIAQFNQSAEGNPIRLCFWLKGHKAMRIWR